MGSVFYDGWYTAHIAGPDADLELQKLYVERADLVVVCFSKEYAEKAWTLAEWKAIRAHDMSAGTPSGINGSRFLPLRVGEGTFPACYRMRSGSTPGKRRHERSQETFWSVCAISFRGGTSQGFSRRMHG